ncbi:hypothetical protein LXL04_008821 [Taraxacum kok-saghyz]
MENECVLNEGATIVTETELGSTTPETVNTITSCFPNRNLVLRTGFLPSSQPATPADAPLMSKTWPLGSNNMSPMTRAKGMVSMTHWGLGSDILIRPHVSKAPSNIPLFAFTNAPFGAPPQTNTSTAFTVACVILKGSNTAEPVLG